MVTGAIHIAIKSFITNLKFRCFKIISYQLSLSIILFISIPFVSIFSQTCDNVTYYSAGTGNFSDANRWSTTSGGAGNYTYNPADPNKHIFIVERGHTVTVSSPVEVNNLIIGSVGANATVIANANITLSCVNDSILINNNGILQLNGNYLAAPGTNNKFSMVGGLLRINNEIPAFLSAFENISLSGGTVDYIFTGNQTINILNYFNLTTSGSGIKTLNAGINVKGNITLSAGTTLSIGADNANISLSGNWINQGVFNTNNRLTYTEFNNTTVNQNITGYTIFQALRINKSSGTAVILNDSIRVNTNLNFTGDGILSLGTRNLILSANISQVNSSTGSFSSNRMIQLNGTSASGKVIKEITSASGLVFEYPIGTGSFYTPVIIGPINATVSGTARISVNSVPFASALNNIVKRYVNLSTLGISNITQAPLRLYYDNTEEAGVPNKVIRIVGAVTENVTDAEADLNTNFFGAGTENLTIAGEWRFENSGALPVTYYSYQNGNWTSSTTWTTDPTGTTQIGMPTAGPTAIDHVVVLNGRTVTVSNNTNTVASLNIQEGGIVDLGTTINHNFGTLFGAGTLRLASVTIPAGNITSFVSAGGGTIEYTNSANFTFTQLTYNNIIVNLNAANLIATLAGNLTINGNLTVRQGIFQINNTANTARNINILGNVDVENTGRIETGTGNAGHRFIVLGNFTNNGVVRFTNQAAPNYTAVPTNGYVSAVFNNDYFDQNIICNGQTDFYRIEIDKGSDYTYILNIDASNSSNFALFGRNNYINYSMDPPPIPNNNALALVNGTCRLGRNIVLPCLATNTYYVYENAQLWLDGSQVTFTSSGGSNDWGLYLYGKLKITGNSTFTNGTNAVRGIVMREQSAIEMESGNLFATGIRTSGLGGVPHRGAFVMRGGTLTLYGTDNNANSYGTFSLGWPDNVIEISGGTININNPIYTGGTGNLWSLHLGMDIKNTRITGGVINLSIPNGNNIYINSTAPLWDLNITGVNTARDARIVQYTTAGGANPPTLVQQPLVVQHDLNLTNSAVLNTNSYNLTVGHDFSMSATSIYNPGNNTTIFNGSGNQIFTNAGTINGGGLNNVSISNTSNTSILSNNLTVRNNLEISKGCTLQDRDHYIYVAGNILNSGNHISMPNGGIVLNGAANQTIGGDGNGIFGNLIINKGSGLASLVSNQALTGNLRLANGLLDISTYKLALGLLSNVYDALNGTGTNFNNSKMIRAAGNISDGGVSKLFDITSSSFVFPVGSGAVYTPFTANVAASSYGTLTVRTVNKRHPALSIPPASVNDALSYFWKVSSEGFSGITSASYLFNYQVSLIPGGDGSDNTFLTGRINENSNVWETQSGVDALNNRFAYNSASSINGEFTAGNTAAFDSILVLESIQTGTWETPATWRKLKGGVVIEPVSSTAPNASTAVVINSGHIVTVTSTTIAANSSTLEIKTNAVLDLGTTISVVDHNFGTFISNSAGNGTLRISSNAGAARFPAGDFGNFLGINGGTVEYYRISTNFTIPTTSITPTSYSLQTYRNLTITPNNGTITLPNLGIRIYGDLISNATVAGSSALLSNAANGDLQIEGNILVSGQSSLLYQNGTIRNIKLKGNLSVENNATFGTANTGTVVANTLEIGGNIINNGTLRLLNGACFVNTTFNGLNNSSITGTGANTVFNRLILDKGIDTTYNLEVFATSFSIQATSSGVTKGLELKNGTFKLLSNQIITLSSGANNGANFQIPSTAQLWINNGRALVNATGTNAGLYLGGKLKVSGNGEINISSSGTNNNFIEYSGVGKPTIEISGGQLIVGSQIRRLTSTTSGSLVYIQSGGSVRLGTQSAPVSERGVIEVLNPGSEFRMTGGTLTIIRPQTTPTVAALYLNPAYSDVQNSTIFIGEAGVAATNIQINSSIPLWNLTVGAASGTAISGLIAVNNLTLLRNLTINNGATLNTNNLNVSIGGDFVTNGTYNCGTNITAFNGSAVAQNISGNVSFYNLTIDNTSSTGLVTLNNNNIQVTKLLNISNGVLFDNGYTLNVSGNIENSAEHRSSGTGRILLTSTVPQYLSGSGLGIFGSIELNNRAGIDLTSNQTINNTLTFTRGLLNIYNNRLTLGSSFNVLGTISDTTMIRTSGSQSDNGIQINVSGVPFDFLVPFGVTGKYTPARFTSATNANSGVINVKPINTQHPVTSDALNKEINYYWQVSSSGLSGTVLTHEYRYVDLDVIGRGTESDYIGARYYSGAWTTTGTVNSSQNRIIFANVNFIDGDYLAGEMSEFSIVVSAYQTASSGNWENGSTWVGGIVPVPNANVIINPNHIVTINTSTKRTYSLYIRNNAEVIIGTTTNHNFGITHGTGTLTIGSNIFPGGDYSGLVAADSGTIKYTHTGNISNALNSYNNLIIASSGSLSLPFITPLTIRGNCVIESGNLTAAGQRIILYRNLTVTGNFTPGSSTIEFRGSVQQIVTNSSLLNFWNLICNNSAGMNITGSIQINGNFTFTNGQISLIGSNEAIFAAAATHSGASDISFINGIVHKISTGTGFTFPVGNGQYRPVTLGNFSGDYTVQYINTAYNPATITTPLTRASDFESWIVNRTSGTSNPDVTLRWSNSNQIPVVSTINNLRIAYWNTSAWEETTATPVYTGTLNSGTITVNGFNQSGRITLATTDNPSVQCPGTTNLYQADNVILADSYTWTTDNASLVTLTPDGADPKLVTATFSTINEGSGNIILTVRRGAVVLAVKNFAFQVYPGQPIISVTGSTDFCEGSSVILSVPASFNAYEWNSGQVTPSITVDASGTFSVRVQHSNGCWSSFSNSQTVTERALPIINDINSLNTITLR